MTDDSSQLILACLSLVLASTMVTILARSDASKRVIGTLAGLAIVAGLVALACAFFPGTAMASSVAAIVSLLLTVCGFGVGIVAGKKPTGNDTTR